MLIIISPAKKLEPQISRPVLNASQPEFLHDAQQLNNILRNLSPEDLESLQSISPKFAQLNFERNLNWSTPFTEKNAQQALFMFQGDVYQGMDAKTFSTDDCQFANKHLRILSGLYGLLRPLDLMQAYRLEMGTILETAKGKNLYELWGDKITQSLNVTMKAMKTDTLINLASGEYFKSIKPKLLSGNIVTPVFKENKNGQLKVIGICAKRARGLMSRYIIQNKLIHVTDIKKFEDGNYQFREDLSTENEWVFVR